MGRKAKGPGRPEVARPDWPFGWTHLCRPFRRLCGLPDRVAEGRDLEPGRPPRVRLVRDLQQPASWRLALFRPFALFQETTRWLGPTPLGRLFFGRRRERDQH